MTYTLQTQYTSASCNWKPGAGNGRVVKGITIHWWGRLGSSFEGIRDFLCSARPLNPTSAHYVAQGADANGVPRPLVACIVDPDDIAYACGNWTGNLTTISIECRPEARDADYAVVAELCVNLRKTYGKVPIYPHNYWVATDCPGAWDIARLNRMIYALENPVVATVSAVRVDPNPNIAMGSTLVRANVSPPAAGTFVFEYLTASAVPVWSEFKRLDAVNGKAEFDWRFGGSHPIRVRFVSANTAAYASNTSPSVNVVSVDPERLVA
jgi:hypothetical protein